MAEVVSLGECMTLVFPVDPVGLDVSDALRIDMAGAESNLCIGLSRLGHASLFISRLGDDPFGERIRAQLNREGVDTRALMIDPVAPTGVFFRENLPDGRRRVYYYRSGSAASRLSPEDLKEEWFEGIRILHLTGITPALSATCAAACWRAVELARKHNALISFDPNYRSRLWDEATAQKALVPFIEAADILLMGHEDARAVLCTAGAQECLRAAASLGPRVVVLKQAERGAMALFEGEVVTAPAYPARQVLDPVGAGDGFDAGFLSGWLRGLGLVESLRLGALVGARAVEVFGDYQGYPSADEI